MEEDKRAFENRLRRAIEECGKWITEHAADIVGEADGRTSLVIRVNLIDGGCVEAPTSTVERTHISREATEAYWNV